MFFMRIMNLMSSLTLMLSFWGCVPSKNSLKNSRNDLTKTVIDIMQQVEGDISYKKELRSDIVKKFEKLKSLPVVDSMIASSNFIRLRYEPVALGVIYIDTLCVIKRPNMRVDELLDFRNNYIKFSNTDMHYHKLSGGTVIEIARKKYKVLEKSFNLKSDFLVKYRVVINDALCFELTVLE
jgi:hypothetical protein